jgi:hypothetical protein
VGNSAALVCNCDKKDLLVDIDAEGNRATTGVSERISRYL